MDIETTDFAIKFMKLYSKYVFLGPVELPSSVEKEKKKKGKKEKGKRKREEGRGKKVKGKRKNDAGDDKD